MQRSSFSYRIEAIARISGHDLAVLNQAARRHPEPFCRNAFALGGFGFGWMNLFLAEGETLEVLNLESLSSTIAVRTVDVTVTGKQLDTCRRILLSGSSSSQLMLDIMKILREMNEESRRLKGTV